MMYFLAILTGIVIGLAVVTFITHLGCKDKNEWYVTKYIIASSLAIIALINTNDYSLFVWMSVYIYSIVKQIGVIKNRIDEV